MITHSRLGDAIWAAGQALKSSGKLVKPKTWQAREVQVGMWEVFNFSFTAPMPESAEALVAQVNPTLPWAEDHFGERVSGIPMNPAPSFAWWPYYKQDEKWRPDGKVFSHTYPERIWTPPLDGIRYRYGNLEDVIQLLAADPMTRQAFLPIWFPEDTGAHHGERVPCTIGYWFIHRGGRLNMFYPIRSCDFRRHFRNDVYLAVRMAQWVLEELKNRSMYWEYVQLGDLTMQIWNLHVFEGEQNLI